MSKQNFDNRRMAADGRTVEWRTSRRVLRVDTCTLVEEELHDACISMECSIMQRGPLDLRKSVTTDKPRTSFAACTLSPAMISSATAFASP
mmetsp:Transcript_36732/g.79405  ORF Transcript_36732/g.79405 Transcript_36732/m.79405 type:complete len:91 (+) Transcript_36732:396-668(+)